MQKDKYSTIDKQKLNNSNNTINIRNLISDHYHKKNEKEQKIPKKSLFLGLLLTIVITIFEQIFSPKFFCCYRYCILMLKINNSNKKTGVKRYKSSVIYKKLKSHYLIFMCLFTFFIVQNYKNLFKSRSRVLKTQHFWAHNNSFTLSKIFSAKITNINFICPLAPFIAQNFKKSVACI